MFWYGKQNWEKPGGYHVFCRTFLSHSAKTNRRGTLPCSKKCLAKIFSSTGGGALLSYRMFFLSRSGKKFVGGTRVFRKRSVMEKTFWLRRRVSRFSVEIFLSHSAKKIAEEAFCVLKSSGNEKFYAWEGGGLTVLSEMICFT